MCCYLILIVELKMLDLNTVSCWETGALWNFPGIPFHVWLINGTSLEHFAGLIGLYPKQRAAVWVATLQSF